MFIQKFISIKLKKLITTNKNCIKVKIVIFKSKLFEFFKFFIGIKKITKEKKSPKIKE